MTKKHFIALAVAIGGIVDNDERARVAHLIGQICAECNGNFNWATWNKACNV